MCTNFRSTTLQLFVDGSSIVLRVAVLTMQVPSRSSASRLLAAPGDSAERLRGRLISHKGGWIEVVEALDVRTHVEPLGKALERIAEATHRMIDLRHNALALEHSAVRDEMAVAKASSTCEA